MNEPKSATFSDREVAEVEEQLRALYAELPHPPADAAAAAHAAWERGTVRRRRRAVLATGGALTGAAAAATVVLTAASVMGSVPSGRSTLDPAAAGHSGVRTSQSPASPSSPSSPSSSSSSSSTSIPGSETIEQNHGRKIAGVGGYLLPRDGQLPSGLAYNRCDDGLTPTRRANIDATSGAVFLADNLGYAGNVDKGDRNAVNDFGIVATAWDLAGTKGCADGDTTAVNLYSNITRFTDSAHAKTAIAKAQRANGVIAWMDTPSATLPWSGASGAPSGSYHRLWRFDGTATGTEYLAVQVIDDFIVSANSENSALATQGVSDMVDNLRSADLVR